MNAYRRSHSSLVHGLSRYAGHCGRGRGYLLSGSPGSLRHALSDCLRAWVDGAYPGDGPGEAVELVVVDVLDHSWGMHADDAGAAGDAYGS